MRANYLILTVALSLFSLYLVGQSYTPNSNTVPAISRWQARLDLAVTLKKCAGPVKFYIYGRGSNYALELINLDLSNDKTLQLDFLNWDKTPFGSKYFPYSDIGVLTVEKAKNSMGETYISQPGAKKQDRLYLINTGFDTCKHIADLLFLLKYKSAAMQDSADKTDLENFRIIAINYNSLMVKPALNEEVRKYLVQASIATDQKRYTDGIDFLRKAIAIDPSYPQAHFNRGLLWAQASIFEAAILDMKKYLLLVPEAEDARASQDKIYEWQEKINK